MYCGTGLLCNILQCLKREAELLQANSVVPVARSSSFFCHTESMFAQKMWTVDSPRMLSLPISSVGKYLNA